MIAFGTNCTEPGSEGGYTLRDACVPSAFVALGGALFVGTLGTVLLRWAARSHLRGRSDAVERFGSLTVTAFLSLVAVTFFTLSAVGFVLVR
jgi:hypothetical protein